MRIPAKYQVFDQPVEISDKDNERLSVHASGWNRLNEILLLGINESDLRRLVVIELMGPRRMAIIDRLIGRISKLEKARIRDRIQKLVV
ncbi:MAG: hypothetical protein RL328_761 [Acidobacteriota bacterium]|jgi:hypothetical protein